MGQDTIQQQWLTILSFFTSIQMLTIACNDQAERGFSPNSITKDAYVMLRICIERSAFAELRTLQLSPVPPIGLMHFRWSGGGAYGEARGSQVNVWQRLSNLDLEILNPLENDALSPAQEAVFFKVLSDFLRSFQPTVSCLKLTWLGASGPITILRNVADEGLDVGEWKRLRNLWLAGCHLDEASMRELRAHCPRLESIMFRKPVPKGPVVQNSAGSGLWIDLLERAKRTDNPLGRG